MIKSIIRMVAATAVLAFATIWVHNRDKDIAQIQNVQPLKSTKSDLERFMDAVAYRESNGNHRVVNQLGMMGKYQFSKTTLRGLRRDISPSEFLQNPHVQDTVMILYLKVNNRMLGPLISRYDGKTFKGIRITRSGILAAAHLGGPGSVISWFRNPNDAGLVDANGTSIREYMTKFSGYPIKRNLI